MKKTALFIIALFPVSLYSQVETHYYQKEDTIQGRGGVRHLCALDILIVPDKSQHFSLFTLSGMYED